MNASGLLLALTLAVLYVNGEGSGREEGAIESSIAPISAEQLKNLRFFGVTQTIATTLTVYDTQPIFVHPTCIAFVADTPPCVVNPPTTTTTTTTTTPAPTTTTTPAPTPAPTLAPTPVTVPTPLIVIKPAAPVETVSAGISFHRPTFPLIQLNLPRPQPAGVVVVATKPVLNASAAASIGVNGRSIQPSAVAAFDRLEVTAVAGEPSDDLEGVSVDASMESGQSGQSEYEIVGLPFSVERLFLPIPIPIFGIGSNKVTLIKYDRVTVTAVQLVTSAYPVESHQDRVTLTIAGCIPNDLPQHPLCD